MKYSVLWMCFQVFVSKFYGCTCISTLLFFTVGCECYWYSGSGGVQHRGCDRHQEKEVRVVCSSVCVCAWVGVWVGVWVWVGVGVSNVLTP